MKQKGFNLAALTIVGLMLVMVSLMLVGGGVQAAPPAAPTPIANVVVAPEGRVFNFQTATALTADTNTTGRSVLDFNTLDIQTTIDHGTLNTTTVTIQWSNDNSNWHDGPALVSANAADASDITRVPVFGRYARVKQDLTNSNSITITLIAVGR